MSQEIDKDYNAESKMTLTEEHSQQVNQVRLCQNCELPVDKLDIPKGQSAHCPRCNTQLYRGGERSINGDLALAVACLLLFIPSHFFPFISIRLFGVMIPATLPDGTFSLMQEGFVGLGLLVLFCASIAPFIVCMSVVVAHLSLRYRWFRPLQYSLLNIQHLKHWMMLDVFLISIGISCFKLQDYADIFVGWGLLGLIMLQLFSLMLVTRISVRRYWETWQPESGFDYPRKDIHCHSCHLSQPDSIRCDRCDSPLHHRRPFSVQKTWAYLIAASIAIIPANVIPISILLTNGKRLEDTIFSGVASLVKNGMPGIAVIIFVASIVVPAIKILGLGYILLSVQFKQKTRHRTRMNIYFAVKWIGKWSMMDLFVISIMMTLVDRGQILDFTPGYGAVAFAIVVILTMLATESLDPRLIWDHKEVPERKATLNE